MGIFDSIKSAFGKGEAEVEVQEPAAVPTPAPEPPVAVLESAEEDSDGARTYTVVSGDTLWKIAERMYGNGSHYMKIFEANSDVLESPDQIFPGQELVIPEL